MGKTINDSDRKRVKADMREVFKTEIENCIKTLEQQTKNPDKEEAHIIKDSVLVYFLEDVGLGDVAREYRLGEKWYS